jgi:hypothetical protein
VPSKASSDGDRYAPAARETQLTRVTHADAKPRDAEHIDPGPLRAELFGSCQELSEEAHHSPAAGLDGPRWQDLQLGAQLL